MAISHPLEPLYNQESKILILGSFPSVKSREMGFYYAHPQNRFWKVLSSVLDVPCPATVEQKKAMLLEHHIALWDVIASCEIEGSSDSSIHDVIPNNLNRILSSGSIRMIYCNGNTAYRLYQKYLQQKYSSYPVTKLPSTSPANAACQLPMLCTAWARIMHILKRDNWELPYYSLNCFAQDFYDCKLYRLSLSGGFTCPNRDGKIDTRGCIFCDGGGAGDFGGGSRAIPAQLDLQKQLIAAKLPKNKCVKYIAYFQSFTGTYAPADRLRKIYSEAVADPQVAVLSIATRPDCLGPEVLEVLAEMNRTIPVWIELGLQTANERTAEYIRRGYPNKEYAQAVRNLQAIGIREIITHIILGLPNETRKDMLYSIQYACDCGTTGLKLQLLHVLEQTDLAADYEAGAFEVLALEEYLEIVEDCIRVIPPDIVIHRLTGDGNKKHLIAPLWSADKKRVINEMSRRLKNGYHTKK
ncbi:TIGR01212 family radical SAM protein [Agathobacter ruminis]|nr:TIGR01212 family radical SAM protein [Agathobacter ruminis]